MKRLMYIWIYCMLRFQFWFNMICLHVYSRVDRMIKTCSKYKEIFKKNSGNLLKSFFIIISKMINKFSCYITIIMLFSSIINQMKQKLILMILLKLWKIFSIFFPQIKILFYYIFSIIYCSHSLITLLKCFFSKMNS